MELIPAIDLLDGKVVRLHQGKYDQVTVYDDDPVAMARRFEGQGAERLHVVDLEGARRGQPAHVPTIEGILRETKLQVQVGGGVRNEDIAAQWMGAGAARVVLGTVVVKEPDIARAICDRYPRGVVMALDARDGKIAVEGWQEQSAQDVTELAKQVDGWNIGAILFTNIHRDGTREGPDVEATARLQSQVQTTVIASGGIGSLDDLRALRAAGVRSSVCGRALYSGAFSLPEAFAALEES
ncbi:MAG: 1-(5-phosphoribosyl)-5-[(5-phosphoribosylamino)methylideneamino]imidazole-4-carboxamide isomerase [Deltaproteobacteria bacterium]|nr:1-(5-phosphoribosyl)-5-[(5-phosphoribosylamino)methylideneamino]imidazole-4-carboxamide isomerase [Deltaproteobacteria bacterium]NND29435.1 1-(5-phosphoribosyl)-5-[(5-phosphoribosylamino)methylideneamino]imidazole-4-carboxamide isomerase [Myxococcales bacterium]MBT8463401.1 1-(5-phosphoribosyl)-5-[(5-phosphoribosylamino)methylideneamino]imidazole-4-carboxamide isomerase [Deltaproteobacteria bacterium]MBT8480695.1 1-(5-phosphoribosyl)-5-[(5-phosphoribosylamino)methylideneamino]imidazole-4-carb